MHVYGSKDAIWNGSKDWCRRTLITTLFMRAKTGNSLKVQHRDWLNKLWCIHVMEYHTAIKNDGPVKECLTTWENVYKILWRKKKSRLQNSMLHITLTLLKQLLKKESPGSLRLFMVLFHRLQDTSLINACYSVAQRKAWEFNVWRPILSLVSATSWLGRLRAVSLTFSHP